MPRHARIKNSEYGIYHIIERGNERKNIFLDDLDRERFIEIIIRNKVNYGFKIYAYCLMSNHVHILLDSNGTDISQVMKSINISYVRYFNRKYQRCGHLFQDRFKSQYIDSNEYALEVSRYIHLNPVRAGILNSKDNQQYEWSSYQYYANKDCADQSHVDLSFLLSLVSINYSVAQKQYIEYVVKDDEEYCQDISNIDQVLMINNDIVAVNSSLIECNILLKRMAEEYGVNWQDIINKRSIYKNIRDTMIRKIRILSQLSLREIGELFGGLSESSVSKIIGK